MPQALLPLFPEEETRITSLFWFEKRDGMVYYFHGGFPVFCHAEEDRQSFRMFTSQLVVNGNCKQVDIVRAFGVSEISMKRYVKKYREGGPAAFFQPTRARRPHVLTKEVMSEAQSLLNEGVSRSDVAKRLDVKSDTFSKAIRSGRLVEPVKKTMNESVRKANGV
jgi:transposase